MSTDQLKLDNQLCFPVYAASRLIIREYQPFLDKLGITYPQYLVLMVLWENDGLTVNEISEKLILNTNTTTPLLKRLEKQQIITRTKDKTDERKVIIKLTKKGAELKNQAACIPEQLVSNLAEAELKIEDLMFLKSKLHSLINFLKKDAH